MSKRARRSSSIDEEIISCMKQNVSDGDHQQENGHTEEKPTSISVASTINFHSRKVRNAFLPDKEKTQLSQEIFLKGSVAVCTALLSEDAEEALLKGPIEGCKALSTEDAGETILKSLGAECRALPAEDAGEIILKSPVAGCKPFSTEDTQGIMLKCPIAACKALSTEDAVAMAIEHLKKSDLRLCCVIEMYDKPKFQKCQGAFQALVQSIVYQQLAIKSAAMIHGRLISLCGLLAIFAFDCSYHPLGHFPTVQSLHHQLHPAHRVSSASIQGFFLGLFSSKLGVQKLYGLQDLPAPAEMEFLCNSWRPYRSIGSWYMWRFIGTKGPIFTSE